jgi:putative phosphoesterase
VQRGTDACDAVGARDRQIERAFQHHDASVVGVVACPHAIMRARVMKICILSDSHDRAAALADAVRDAASNGAQAVIHCGDVIGTQTLRAAMAVGLPMHVIHGNNLGDPVSLSRLARESGDLVRYSGADARLELAGRRVFVVHYPEYGYAMALTGDFDLVCCGHSHEAGISQVQNVKGGQTWLVNPGTVAGVAAPATWVLGDLAAMRFELRTLGSAP